MCKKKGFCIICRQHDKELSDEHVIPFALGGVYHVYDVCRKCNSMLGDMVDMHLTEHWFLKGFRHIFKLEGKKGHIPNPLIGFGTLESGARVKTVEDDSGTVKPVLLPTKPQVTEDTDGRLNIEFSVDPSDKSKIDDIITKILKRRRVDPSKVKVISTERVETAIERPMVTQTVSIDLHKFKLAIVKIAYEFAVDKTHGYFNDPTAIKISRILHDADTDAVSDELFLGSGFTVANDPHNILADYIDFNNHRHILVLANIQGSFYGIIYISTIFSGAVKLAEGCYGPDNSFLHIAINDILTKTCDFYTMDELVGKFLAGGGVKL